MSSDSDVISGGNIAVAIVSVITGGVVIIVVSVLIYKCCKLRMIRKYGGDLPVLPLVETTRSTAGVPAPPIGSSGGYGGTVVDVVKDRPVRFSSSQLQEFTGNYSERLGAGGFGVVYRGQIQLPGDGGSLAVAVKVLGSHMGRRAEEQFMAEIGTIGRTSHVNLVRLYGFCFDTDVKALVYEFMPNGSLDRHLFHGGDGDGEQKLGFDKLYDIAVGTAKAVRYLHDDCERRIIHYDIKPGNVLLDEAFCPRVADFGLARLCERERTHVTLTGGGGGRGTPGYAAPELWMAAPATHKCDVYSYGMLLFEILGRRRNYAVDVDGESAERWYPRWVWQRLERGEMDALVARALVADADRAAASKQRRKKVERLCAVALWCVQYRPEDRPSMSGVVRMLEGDEDVAAPAVSPFAHLDSDLLTSRTFTDDDTNRTTTTFGSAA